MANQDNLASHFISEQTWELSAAFPHRASESSRPQAELTFDWRETTRSFSIFYSDVIAGQRWPGSGGEFPKCRQAQSFSVLRDPIGQFCHVTKVVDSTSTLWFPHSLDQKCTSKRECLRCWRTKRRMYVAKPQDAFVERSEKAFVTEFREALVDRIFVTEYSIIWLFYVEFRDQCQTTLISITEFRGQWPLTKHLRDRSTRVNSCSWYLPTTG